MKGETYRVFCVGTVDTKLDELRFLAGSVRSNIGAFSKNSSSKVRLALTKKDSPESLLTNFTKYEGFDSILSFLENWKIVNG